MKKVGIIACFVSLLTILVVLLVLIFNDAKDYNQKKETNNKTTSDKVASKKDDNDDLVKEESKIDVIGFKVHRNDNNYDFEVTVKSDEDLEGRYYIYLLDMNNNLLYKQEAKDMKIAKDVENTFKYTTEYEIEDLRTIKISDKVISYKDVSKLISDKKNEVDNVHMETATVTVE